MTAAALSSPSDLAFEGFNITQLNNTYLVEMPHRFMVQEAQSFEEIVNAILQDRPKSMQVVLDFGATTMMDSSGVMTLQRCLKTAIKIGISLSFWSFSPALTRLLAQTDLKPVLNESDALSLTASQQAPLPQSVHPSITSPVKRFVDIVGACVGLGITGLLLAPIGLAIKLTSPGPIFFSQTRCGYLGRQFRIWKFRSMVTNADALKHQIDNQVEGPLFKNENDPRITSIGKILRKTSLDEFPQFWNVLKGDMSLVGTRPPTLDEVETYEVTYNQRLDVKPGLTGEWQVNGRSTVTAFEDVLQLDLNYQKNWSLWYDLKLIVKTIWVIFSKESGAC